jgi:hypothetical protein
VRWFSASIFVLCFIVVAPAMPIAAQEAVVDVADWLPDSTQGFARVVDFPRFMQRWKQTQLGILADDERLQPFWKEQQKTIEARFAEAGWKLNLTGDDVSKVASGQSAIAWISKPKEPKKPYAVALIVDVRGNKPALDTLMARVDGELKAKQATSEKIDYQGTPVTHYTLPRGAGAVVVHESFYAVHGDYLIAVDELAAMREILDAKTKSRSDALSKSPLFTKALARIPATQTSSDVEYFVQPIGLAKLLRSISGKPVSSQTDILKVLDEQGFSKLSAVVGRLRFANAPFDVYHEAFVQADPPLPISVQVLDFPNQAGNQTPTWVSSKAASYSSVAWNAKEAFWKVKNLVDAVAGQAGTFDSVIEGIQSDPVGPQIDIKNQVLPFITPEIYSVSEVVDPITTDSRRSLLGIRVNDPNGKLASALERAMKNEPDASPEDFGDVRIWKVAREDDANDSLKVETDFDFGPKKSKSTKEKEQAEEPLLNNWAITIASLKSATGANEQYLMFASHAEMIKEAITIGRAAKADDSFEKQADVARVIKELTSLANNQPGCVWAINRSDLAFRMQYELFRQDKLPQSRSMLATVLDRILRPKDELKNVSQEVKGDKLPPFDQIREFFTPGGGRVTTQADGWAYQGFILGK